MKQETKLSQIREHIRAWNEVRQTESALHLITSGYALEVSRGELQHWMSSNKEAPPTHIHLYLAKNAEGLLFYLVDATTDSSGDDSRYQLGRNLLEKRFHRFVTAGRRFPERGIPNLKVPESQMMESAFQWFLYAEYWFLKKQHEEGGPVQVFRIPIDDFTAIFEEATVSTAFLMFCLEDIEQEVEGTTVTFKDEISVFLCSRKTPEEGRITDRDFVRIYTNVGVPTPPFPPATNQFGLLGS